MEIRKITDYKLHQFKDFKEPMGTKNEAIQLALDAIITYAPDYMHGLPKEHFIKVLRKALEKNNG